MLQIVGEVQHLPCMECGAQEGSENQLIANLKPVSTVNPLIEEQIRSEEVRGPSTYVFIIIELGTQSDQSWFNHHHCLVKVLQPKIEQKRDQ